MPKLNLKRTPEEEAAASHRHQKSKKRKTSHHKSSSTKRSQEYQPYYDIFVEDPDGAPSYGPQPAASTSAAGSGSSSGDNMYENLLYAEIEDARFREKLSTAMEDDFSYGYSERLDSLETKFNDYAHVPDRYRASGARTKGASRNVYDEDDIMGAADGWSKLDPRWMDDEEYAEYLRMGMYRKTHAQEYEEKQRQKEMRAKKKEAEKAQREELKRLKKEEEERAKRRKAEKDSKKWAIAKKTYDERWKALLAPSDANTVNEAAELSYSDVPWPMRSADSELTENAIGEFVLWGISYDKEAREKERKERCRETMLRFHPDKFEVRVLKRVRERDQERVRQAMGLVVRTVKKLMGET